MTDRQQQLHARERHYLSRPERFACYRDDIGEGDDALAIRISRTADMNAQDMANALADLADAANRFANAVYHGAEPDQEDLGDWIDRATSAVYEWGKNHARIDGWKERNRA